MIRVFKKKYSLLVFVVMLGCVGTKGIISFHDPLFSDLPHIINIKDEWFMKFGYSGSSSIHNYFMLSSSFVREDTLIFYVPATSSSFISRERLQLERINSTKKIQYLKSGKVFWLQTDGELVQMPVYQKDSLTSQEYKGIMEGYSH